MNTTWSANSTFAFFWMMRIFWRTQKAVQWSGIFTGLSIYTTHFLLVIVSSLSLLCWSLRCFTRCLFDGNVSEHSSQWKIKPSSLYMLVLNVYSGHVWWLKHLWTYVAAELSMFKLLWKEVLSWYVHVSLRDWVPLSHHPRFIAVGHLYNTWTKDFSFLSRSPRCFPSLSDFSSSRSLWLVFSFRRLVVKREFALLIFSIT